MVEPVTTVGLGAIGAYLGKDGLNKLLGPTAEYLGGGIKDFTQKRIESIGKIFENAEKKLGPKVEAPGVVPPKVLKTIMNEGSYSTENIACEYFGGILASSRTELGRDDRGARMAKIVDGLSTYQLRSHFLIYSTINRLFSGSGIFINIEGRPKLQIFIPYSDYVQMMEFNAAEALKWIQLMNHSLFGLSGEGLIERFRYGDANEIKSIFSGAKEPGIVCVPSSLGVELFLWAFGLGDKDPEYMLDPKFLPKIDEKLLYFSKAYPAS